MLYCGSIIHCRILLYGIDALFLEVRFLAAASKKSSSGKKRTQTSRKTNTRQKKNSRTNQEEDFTREVVLWVVVAVSILLFISNFGIGGTIGNAVSRFFFGLFGLIAYVFPIVLLTGTFFAVSNKGNTVAVVKIVAAVLFVTFLCMFIELLKSGATVFYAARSLSLQL